MFRFRLVLLWLCWMQVLVWVNGVNRCCSCFGVMFMLVLVMFRYSGCILFLLVGFSILSCRCILFWLVNLMVLLSRLNMIWCSCMLFILWVGVSWGLICMCSVRLCVLVCGDSRWYMFFSRGCSGCGIGFRCSVFVFSCE